jgi:hypothetical protein
VTGQDAHEFPEPLDFMRFDLDAALSLRASLEVADPDLCTANDEKAVVRLAQPIIERRNGDTEPQSGLLRAQQLLRNPAAVPTEERQATLPVAGYLSTQVKNARLHSGRTVR